MQDINSSQTQLVKVTVTDVDISFGQMVALILKFTFACIPAAIVVGFFGFAAMTALAVMGAVLK